MRAVAKRPGEPGEVVHIDNDLEALQDYVGGHIETVTISDKVCVICNEEGLVQGLPYNVKLFDRRFVGNILIVGVDGDNFTDCPIQGFLLDSLNRIRGKI